MWKTEWPTKPTCTCLSESLDLVIYQEMKMTAAPEILIAEYRNRPVNFGALRQQTLPKQKKKINKLLYHSGEALLLCGETGSEHEFRSLRQVCGRDRYQCKLI